MCGPSPFRPSTGILVGSVLADLQCPGHDTRVVEQDVEATGGAPRAPETILPYQVVARLKVGFDVGRAEYAQHVVLGRLALLEPCEPALFENVLDAFEHPALVDVHVEGFQPCRPAGIDQVLPASGQRADLPPRPPHPPPPVHPPWAPGDVPGASPHPLTCPLPAASAAMAAHAEHRRTRVHFMIRPFEPAS